MPLTKEGGNVHCRGVMAKIACEIGRIKMSHRTWLSSQDPLWTLAQRQLLLMPQVSAEPHRSIALFPGGSTSSQLMYFCIIVCLAVPACGGG